MRRCCHIPRPGNSSNDFDLDFLPEATTIGATSVPANSLLVINGDDSPDTIGALQKGDGTVLATVNIAASGLHVGGSYRQGRQSLFCEYGGHDFRDQPGHRSSPQQFPSRAQG